MSFACFAVVVHRSLHLFSKTRPISLKPDHHKQPMQVRVVQLFLATVDSIRGLAQSANIPFDFLLFFVSHLLHFAAFSLIGIHRWALSGTPLQVLRYRCVQWIPSLPTISYHISSPSLSSQNRVGEFYSLIRFLRLDPMAYYFCRCKDCNCRNMHYRMKVRSRLHWSSSFRGYLLT